MERREFLAASAASVAMTAMPGQGQSATPADMPRRKLGRTGEEVSIVGLGGFHIGKQPDPNESIRIIRAALDGGISFLDNSWDYNNGESEIRMGKALRDGYRNRAFLRGAR